MTSISDKARQDIIADIVGHPAGAPTIEELDYMNPPLTEAEIRQRLQSLCEAGVVQVLELEPERCTRGYPDRFFELTPEARKQFDHEKRFSKGAWERQYAAIDKPDRINELETLSRPDA